MGVMQALKGFNRLKQIVNLLFKEELGFLIHKLGLKPQLEIKHQLKKGEFKKPITSLPQRLRRVMENAGGGMIKLGQLLSLRSDLLPKEYCEEFEKLQDEVKPFPYAKVKQILELELNKPLNKVFKEFSQTPIAAASVGQVHKAKLLTGETVAVKIQRPGIQKTFDTDIEIIHYLAKLADKHIQEIKPLNLPRIASVFEDYTKKELDYMHEAKALELVYQRNKKDPRVTTPKVYWSYTTSKVLVMNFLRGKRVNQIKLTKPERKKLATAFAHNLITQVFEYHIFHADPHPGNILITSGKNLIFLDFGIVGRISPDMIEPIEDMLIGLVHGDLDLLTRSFMEIGIVDIDVNENKFKEDLFEKLGSYHGLSLKTMNMKDFLHDIFEVAQKYHMQFPANFVLLLKALATAEGFSRAVYPESNFVQLASPKVEELKKKRKSFKHMKKEFKRSAWSFTRSIKKIPKDLRSITRMIKKGTKVKVDLDNRDVRELTHEIGTSSNRITFGFIIGALIVGFALIVMARIEPMFYGVPYLALLLLAIIIIISLFLGISIMWEKRGGESE
jgi:ubiquinone biosynthesis protein